MLLLNKIITGVKEMADCKITIEHIELANNALANGASLNKLDKTDTLAGLSRKAFKNNALKLGYIFNNDLNKFIIDSNLSNTTVTPRANKAIAINKDKKKADKMIEFEKRIEKLESIIETLMLQGNTKVTYNDFTLDSRVLNNDIMTRSIKVSKASMEAFSAVAEEKLSMYSKQDLISQALWEFVDKYK